MKGILFKPAVWQAKLKVLLECGEAQTRRLPGLKEINQNPSDWVYQGIPYGMAYFDHKDSGERNVIRLPYRVGETVYVKEAYYTESGDVWYKSDGQTAPMLIKWKSPLFMPAWAARHFCLINNVSAERLRLPLSPEDLQAEGGEAALEMLEKIDGLWVWVYSFRMVER